VSFLSNSNLNSVQWSPNGKFLIFETGQRTETPQLVRVDLVPNSRNLPKTSSTTFSSPNRRDADEALAPMAKAAEAAGAEPRPNRSRR
jgi:tricorn protease